jgi:Fe-S-cluster containining protein
MADEMRYFQCRPGELCKAAECCRDLRLTTELTAGDYLRLSRFSHRSAEDLWREQGSIHLTNTGSSDRDGIFIIRLGLKKDPCPYLSGEPDHECKVYDVMPLNCAQFPLRALVTDSGRLERLGYACVKDVCASPEQIEFYSKFVRISFSEFHNDNDFFWGNKLPFFTSRFSEFGAEVKRISEQQKINDPNLQTHGSKSLMAAMEDFNTLFADPSSELDPQKYIRLMRALMFCKYEDEFARRLTDIERNHAQEYAETSEKWKALLKEMSFQSD